MVPGCPGDRPGLLYCHGVCVFYRHNRDLLDGPFQPASLLALPWGFQELSPSNKCPGVNQEKIPQLTLQTKVEI